MRISDWSSDVCSSDLLAPDDPARRVTVRSDGAGIALYDGRNQAQNGWFVLRSLLPAGKTGRVLRWTVEGASVPGWLRAPVIGHSQLGYVSGQAKVATIELDRHDKRRPPVRLLKIDENGAEHVVQSVAAADWGDFMRYRYLRFDFSDVRDPGIYVLIFGTTPTALFRIPPALPAHQNRKAPC